MWVVVFGWGGVEWAMMWSALFVQVKGEEPDVFRTVNLLGFLGGSVVAKPVLLGLIWRDVSERGVEPFLIVS